MAKGNRGGRGGNSGASNLGSAVGLAKEYNDVTSNDVGDYTDDDNPELLKWQGLSDDDAGHYLHETRDNIDYADYDDGYQYYDSPFQQFVLRLGLNGKTTELSDADFKAYLKATGQQEFYRGQSAAADARFRVSDKSHTGRGMYGDGYYFTLPGDMSTAQSYSTGAITTAAFSPKARIVDLGTVQNAIYKASRKFNKSLSKAGRQGTSKYSDNMGEAQMALKMGYNVIKTGWSYVVLTRDALVVKKK